MSRFRSCLKRVHLFSGIQGAEGVKLKCLIFYQNFSGENFNYRKRWTRKRNSSNFLSRKFLPEAKPEIFRPKRFPLKNFSTEKFSELVATDGDFPVKNCSGGKFSGFWRKKFFPECSGFRRQSKFKFNVLTKKSRILNKSKFQLCFYLRGFPSWIDIIHTCSVDPTLPQ